MANSIITKHSQSYPLPGQWNLEWDLVGDVNGFAVNVLIIAVITTTDDGGIALVGLALACLHLCRLFGLDALQQL